MVELWRGTATQPLVNKRIMEPLKFSWMQQTASGAPELLDMTVCPGGKLRTSSVDTPQGAGGARGR